MQLQIELRRVSRDFLEMKALGDNIYGPSNSMGLSLVKTSATRPGKRDNPVFRWRSFKYSLINSALVCVEDGVGLGKSGLKNESIRSFGFVFVDVVSDLPPVRAVMALRSSLTSCRNSGVLTREPESESSESPTWGMHASLMRLEYFFMLASVPQ
eukprot:2859259-Rhodomonas_salina.1